MKLYRVRISMNALVVAKDEDAAASLALEDREVISTERDCVSPDAAKKTARRFAMENDCPVSVYRGNEVAACNGRAKLVATVKPEEVRV